MPGGAAVSRTPPRWNELRPCTKLRSSLFLLRFFCGFSLVGRQARAPWSLGADERDSEKRDGTGQGGGGGEGAAAGRSGTRRPAGPGPDRPALRRRPDTGTQHIGAAARPPRASYTQHSWLSSEPQPLNTHRLTSRRVAFFTFFVFYYFYTRPAGDCRITA